MAECGDPTLIRSVGGNTPDKPCGYGVLGVTWCNDIDVSNWYSAAESLFSLNRRSWNALVKAEKAANADGTTPKAKALEAEATAYETAFADLPPFEWSVSEALSGEAFGKAGAYIGKVIENMRDGACMLSRLNDALAEVGGSPVMPGPRIPESKGSPLDQSLSTVATVAVVGLLLWALVKFSGK